MNKESDLFFWKLRKHLLLSKDPTVVVLRGHLLFEDLLNELIAINFKNASAIKNARLTFFQKLCIAQGFTNKDFPWEPIKALNTLRNEIGHNLPNNKLSQKIDRTLRSFYEDTYEHIPSDIYSKSKALRKGIIFHCGLLHGVIEGIRAVKKGKQIV